MLTYCKPHKAGLASETPAVARRLGRLLTTMDREINCWICDGQIVNDVRTARRKIHDALIADGWRVKGKATGDGWTVRPPKEVAR